MKVNKNHEVGIVSIMVTMVMLIVISLIVLGFAEISRTEQRNTTDNQLSTEAYYAAESGINDALAVIANLPAGTSPTPKTVCGPTSTQDYSTLTGVLHYTDPTNPTTTPDISYSCLLINPSPSNLAVTAQYKSTVIPLTSSKKFNQLTLNWGLASGSSTTGTCKNGKPPGQFPVDNSSWDCNFPVLRVDLLNANNGQLARNGINGWSNDTGTMFFMPTFGAADPKPLLRTARGSVVVANCTSTFNPQPVCTANINLESGGTTYYMRVTTLYKTDSNLTISANGGVTFSGSQVIIDSTGKAQDVLRRIEVAVDLTDANAYIVPSGALIAENSVCKQFGVAPGIFINKTFNGGGTTDVLCQAH